jgi:hypothetical protein
MFTIGHVDLLLLLWGELEQFARLSKEVFLQTFWNRMILKIEEAYSDKCITQLREEPRTGRRRGG